MPVKYLIHFGTLISGQITIFVNTAELVLLLIPPQCLIY